MVELVIRKKRLKRGLALALLANLAILALLYSVNAEIGVGRYEVGYELRADEYLVTINASGQIQMEYLRGSGDVKLLLLSSNRTIEIPLASWKDAVEVGGAVLLDVSSSPSLVLPGDEILNIVVPRDVRLDLNLTSYAPYHPALTEMTSPACYHLLYFAVARFNVTVNLCRYPLSPSLVIHNKGDRGLLAYLSIEKPKGINDIAVIEIEPREERALNFTGPNFVILDRIEVLYGPLKFELRDGAVIARPRDLALPILAIANTLMAAVIARSSISVKRPRKKK